MKDGDTRMLKTFHKSLLPVRLDAVMRDAGAPCLWEEQTRWAEVKLLPGAALLCLGRLELYIERQ